MGQSFLGKQIQYKSLKKTLTNMCSVIRNKTTRPFCHLIKIYARTHTEMEPLTCQKVKQNADCQGLLVHLPKVVSQHQPLKFSPNPPAQKINQFYLLVTDIKKLFLFYILQLIFLFTAHTIPYTLYICVCVQTYTKVLLQYKCIPYHCEPPDFGSND